MSARAFHAVARSLATAFHPITLNPSCRVVLPDPAMWFFRVHKYFCLTAASVQFRISAAFQMPEAPHPSL